MVENILLRNKQVAWLSHGFGYHGDLMYFRPLLEGFLKSYPNTRVLVEKDLFRSHDTDLPLDPCLKIRTFYIRRPSHEGDYGRILDVPSPSLSYHLLRMNPDLLLLFDFSRVTWLGAFTARLLPNCRVLLMVESDPKFRGVQHQGIQLKIRRMIARQADAILTNNHYGEEYVTQTLGADPSRVIRRPYLTSQPGAWPSTIAKGDAPRRTDERLEFLFLNSINHRKGVDYMLRAVAALDPERRHAMRLRIVGDGPQLAEIEKLADDLQVRDTVEFAGRVRYQDVGDHYRNADVFVAPTLRDYRSLTGFEALSFGLPMLMSCYDGAVDEVIDEGRNGLIVDPRDTAGFAAKFAWFIDNRHRLGEMRQVSAELNRRFTVANVVENLAYASTRAITRS